MSNNQNPENKLLEQYRALEENKPNIQQQMNTLSTIRTTKENELSAIKQQAIQELGTDDIAQLRNIYTENMSHNQAVIPKALEQSNVDLQRIKAVQVQLGLISA